MTLNFVLPYLQAWRRAREERERELKSIADLREQLVKVGYNPQEAGYLVEHSSGGRDLNKLDPISLKKVRESLEAQLLIARQCLELVKKEPLQK